MRSAGIQVAAILWGASILSGCGPFAEYRIDVVRPWPDEPPATRRVSYERRLRLTRETLAWHARLDRRVLAQRARDAIPADAPLYVLTRDGLAKAETGQGPRRLRYVEVRIGPLLVRPAAAGAAGSSRSDAAGMAGLAERAGIRVRLPPEMTGPQWTVTPAAGDDPRGLLMQALVRRDLMLSTARYLPFTIRSYEFPSEATFLRAVRETAALLAGIPSDQTADAIPLSDWRRLNADSLRELMQELTRRLEPARRGGRWVVGAALPTPTVLPAAPLEAERQLFVALPTWLGGAAASH